MPNAGPDQPMDKVILMAIDASLSLRKSLITSDALSVTVSINFLLITQRKYCFKILFKLSILSQLSIVFLPEIGNAEQNQVVA
jgi:hypothetical protein